MFRSTTLVWLLSVCMLASAMLFLPHREMRPSAFATTAIGILLLIQSIRLARREPNRKNKPIFMNFGIFFSTSLLFAAYPLIGPGALIWTDSPYARMVFLEYVSLGLYYLLLALGVVYLSVDALFRDYRTWQKYVLSSAIAGAFFLFYCHSIVFDPMAVYRTSDIADWKAIDHYAAQYQKDHGVRPTPIQIAQDVELFSWNQGRQIGTLFPEERLLRVTELYPYLEGENYLILLYRPLYMNVIYLCVLSVGFILLFFGYQYMKDPPQGAYIERIMFLFLIFCSLEILHAWSFVKSVEWGALAEVLSMGQYVSVAVLLLIAMFFGLRLRFISSVKGEFYETELASSPGGVVRWRDAIDNLVIRHFFDPRWFPRRVLAFPRRFDKGEEQ